MLYIFRLFITVIYCILVCVLVVYIVCSAHEIQNTSRRLAICLVDWPLYGLKVECRMPPDAKDYGNAIYICNHQNNYDMVTAAKIVQPPTVTVGKKPAVGPVFGLLYWLTGNLLIDRNNRAKAHSTIATVVNHFKNVVSLSGCSRKVRVAVAVVCCRLKLARFMRQLPRVFR